MLIHGKPGKGLMRSPHAVNGWYVGTSIEHYRCYTMWGKDTRSNRVSYMVFFKIKYITNPTVTPEDAAVQAAKELKAELQGNLPTSLGDSRIYQLKNWTQYLLRQRSSTGK